MRYLHLSLLAVLALPSPAFAQSHDGGLTRIEPRNFYGASITKEAGVHVYRTLPRTQNYIINPDHKTPLNLVIENRTESFVGPSANGGAFAAPGVASIDGGVANGFVGSPFGFGVDKFGFPRRSAVGGIPAGQGPRPDRHAVRTPIDPPRQRVLGPVQLIKPAAVKPVKPRPPRKY